MLFNSFAFAVFLPTVVALYWLLRKPSAQNLFLLAASYFFYAAWDWRFLSLIVISTLVDFTAGLRIHARRNADPGNDRAGRAWLLLSVSTNLGILGFFKYFNFFSESFAELIGRFGLGAPDLYLNVVLPVGISFYTFQTISYTVDIYRGQLEPTKRIADFALFVAFFPQLVAGPIERARVLLPQIIKPRRFSGAQFQEGLHLIFWGLFKKVFVADNLAPFVDRVFASPDPTGFEVLCAMYAFAFQIYCDFSGYSDIARGSAKCIGMELMVNFRYPYVAENPSDFWRRWHISLSSWLRDYLYIPLGGNRGTNLATYRNLSLTMVLGGLWHGATWLFVLWGAYQGLLLAIHRMLRPFLERFAASGRVPRVHARALKAVVMFHLVCIGWLIFRGESIPQIAGMLSALLSWHGIMDWSIALRLAAFVLPLVLVEALLGIFRKDAPYRLTVLPGFVRTAVYAVLFYLFAIHGASAQSFIYFQF